MDSFPWLTQALKYLGQHEIAGKVDNQFILDCFKYTSYKAGHDEVPWCAAFLNRVLAETGFKGTDSAAAVSFANPSFGQSSSLVPGAILVFKWASGEHHVSICQKIDGNMVTCVGGNQSNMVKASVFDKRWIIATRWPVAV